VNRVLPIIVLIISLSVPSAAYPHECPKTIAVVESNQISKKLLPVVVRIYRELGCKTEFLPFNGRRSLREFTSGRVDGELIRQKIIEKKYGPIFARSTVPVFVNSNSLWVHPEISIRESRPLAYMIGIVWQENYAKGKHAVGLDSSKKTIEAYNRGAISSLITSDFIVQDAILAGEFKPPPVRGEVIRKPPLYHYVNKKYAEFMVLFSKTLAKSQ
jgi:hypothetical protein